MPDVKPRVRILICTGPTGGHFFPAVALAEALQAHHPETEIHFLLNRKPVFFESVLMQDGFDYHFVRFQPPRTLVTLKGLRSLLEYAAAFVAIFALFLKLKPEAVVGFGSYGSVPGVLMGFLFRIPILLHEQNQSAGAANQFLSRWADEIAVSFPETDARWDWKKVFYSGYPLRSDFLSSERHGSGSETKGVVRRLLVFGGSQGAEKINRSIVDAIRLMTPEERFNFAVTHIVGASFVEETRAAYQALGMPAEVFGFSEHIADEMARADLVIARAGAGTIFELAQMNRPAVLIPYPYAGAHQKRNGRYLARREAAWVIEEEHLSADFLRAVLIRLLNDEPARRKFSENIKGLSLPKAHELLADRVWKLRTKK